MSFLTHRRKAFKAGITDPTDIAGLDLWLDASDNSTVLDATDTAASDDEAVKTWQDKSGNANHAVQATAADQPIRRAADVNGLDVLDFVSNDFMIGSAALTPRQTDAKTVFLALASDNQTLGATAVNLYDYVGTPTTGAGGLITVEVAYRCAGRTWVSSSPVSTTTANIITFTHDGQTNIEDAVNMWLDGSSLTNSSGVNGALVDNSESYCIGRQSRGGGIDYDGRICEIIVYDSELSTTDREAVETYLANKWGITL